jgi:uncharacterized protein (UPF0335 family)
MLLKDFESASDRRFSVITRTLKENFNVAIRQDTSLKDLDKIAESVVQKIENLKRQGKQSEKCPELSKYLLMKEAVHILQAKQELKESKQDEVYAQIIKWLCDCVVKSVTYGDEFEDSLRSAMKEYRSSPYRFDDERVMNDVSRLCHQRLEDMTADDTARMRVQESGCVLSDLLNGDELNDCQVWVIDKTGKDLDGDIRSKLHDFYASLGIMPGEADDLDNWYADRLQSDFNVGCDSETAPAPQEQPVILQQGKHEMKFESKSITEGFVKDLRKLLESEVEEAEIVIATKGFSKSLQEMIEKIGRLQNEDLPPLADQMRQNYGNAEAHGFHEKTQLTLQNVLDALYESKEQIDNAVQEMARGNLDFNIDMDLDSENGEDVDADLDIDVEDPMPEVDTDLDAELGDIEAELGDVVGDADEDEALGRPRNESARKILASKIAKLEEALKKKKKA